MLIGICPYCNCQRFGLALLDPQHRKCPQCKVGHLVVNDSHKPTEGYPPFAAGTPSINSANRPSTTDSMSSW